MAGCRARIEDVVRGAAETVAAARHIEIIVNPRHPATSECEDDYDEHRHALVGLLTLSAELATEPRSLHLLIRPEAPPITPLHIRGAGLPTMFTGIPQAQSAAARVVAAVVKQMSARLFVDTGGLVVIYGHSPTTTPKKPPTMAQSCSRYEERGPGTLGEIWVRLLGPPKVALT